jgi:hypothetical protein
MAATRVAACRVRQQERLRDCAHRRGTRFGACTHLPHKLHARDAKQLLERHALVRDAGYRAAEERTEAARREFNAEGKALPRQQLAVARRVHAIHAVGVMLDHQVHVWMRQRFLLPRRVALHVPADVPVMLDQPGQLRARRQPFVAK